MRKRLEDSMNPRPFSDVGILALVPDEWGMVWQPRHHVLTRLAQYFHVIWINPAHEWREIPTRLKTRLTKTSIGGFRPQGLDIYTPELWLPKLYRPRWLAQLTVQQRLARARRRLMNQGCRKIVLYLWRPEFECELRSAAYDHTCYHIDDEYSFSTVEVPLDQAEARLIASVDQVFIHSRALLEKKGTINPNTSYIPNGVDYCAYSALVPEPVDLATIPRPRIGYTGYLKNQLDWHLIVHLTRQHPEWSFVFVGPVKPHPETFGVIEELSRRSNVYFLGPKTAQVLAAYPQHFDVCLMPYLTNDYSRYIYPLKLHEYLASGQPIVGTRIRSLEEFTDVVALASTPATWSKAITEALHSDATTPERRGARQAVARQHDWQVLVGRIARIIAERLGKEFGDRFPNCGSESTAVQLGR